MMSLEAIIEQNEIAARKARKGKKEPLVLDAPGVRLARLGQTDDLRRIPYIGGYLPKGWERVDASHWSPRGYFQGDNEGYGAFFVDATGLGGESEPALTRDQFAKLVRPGYGYAIIEAGQFQVKIGVFMPPRKEREK